ncbi:DUF4216 domain-containing protein [Heracleum sosnowskyi]|uniref:DUF4216 domain-containing protein n=1 Tax=Heracleum sosnowskyi TaxID=360622 RepID=A0AAD8IQP7_9APIA|nr:DUF4216 domain-containing protein [Heracleum sosnowskyi]
MAAHNYVLFNCPKVAPYIEIFTNNLREHNPEMNGAEVDRCLESDFVMWFKHYAEDVSLVSNDYVRDLVSGPLHSVRSVQIYYVNGYKFHTKTYGASKSTFNSGLCIKGSNYNEASNDYFGILYEILIIEYPRRPIKKTVLFKCEWFDPTPNVGTRVHQRYNIVEVNRKKRLSVYEPFVLAIQATQVAQLQAEHMHLVWQKNGIEIRTPLRFLIGGRNKRNGIYGLGSTHDIFYGPSSSTVSHFSESQQNTEEIRSLQDLRKLENDCVLHC